MTFLEENNEKLINYLLEHSNTLVNKVYDSRQIIVHEGDKVEKIGIVREGLLEIVNYTYYGEKKSHEYLKKNTLIPIYQYLAGIKEYKYTLRCEKKAEVSWIDCDEFEKIIKKNPEILYDKIGRAHV